MMESANRFMAGIRVLSSKLIFSTQSYKGMFRFANISFDFFVYF